jgi:8-oxo-dGTP diphosphatase
MVREVTSLLLRAPDARRRPLVLMQHCGDRWRIPGESAGQAAVDAGRVRVRGTLAHRFGDDAGSCTTVVADVAEPLPVRRTPAELAWVPEGDVIRLNLHPAVAAGWPELQVTRITLVVDAANVVGSRPDGWWKDRAGAAERLQREVAAAGPGVLPLPQGGFGWVDSPVLVLEGAASRAPNVPGVEVVRARGTADDTIIDIVTAPGDWLVVTADRPLRARLPPNVHPLSPSAFLSWIGT